MARKICGIDFRLDPCGPVNQPVLNWLNTTIIKEDQKENGLIIMVLLIIKNSLILQKFTYFDPGIDFSNLWTNFT